MGLCFRLAILLTNSHFYTNFVKQIKGEYQLKQRHLEILGYRVFFLNFNEWNRLRDRKHKIEFLKNIIWPNSVTEAYSAVER